MLELRPMTVADIPNALAMWNGMPGISLFPSDSVEGIAKYLERNPSLSVVAILDGKLVGASMAGHDGRRGYLHHVAVVPGLRLRGIGRAMVERCLEEFKKVGLGRCHILVNADNEEGLRFWKHLGWDVRSHVHLLSFTIDAERA